MLPAGLVVWVVRGQDQLGRVHLPVDEDNRGVVTRAADLEHQCLGGSLEAVCHQAFGVAGQTVLPVFSIFSTASRTHLVGLGARAAGPSRRPGGHAAGTAITTTLLR